MPLVDIWKTTPEQLKGKGIQQILGFAGDGRLKEQNSTSLEFRDFLAHVSSEELSAYAGQCLATAFADSGLALQDIVNQVGKRLGFTVEDGRYRGTAKSIGFDGLWHSKDGDTIIVEVKTTDAYRLTLDTTANYRKQLIAERKITENKVSILYVVGRSDTGDLEAQVRGSRHAWDIRLISIDAILRLLRIKEELEDQSTVDRIRDILKPQEFTRVDGIIDLVFSATKEVLPDAVSEEDLVEAPPKKKGKQMAPVNFRSACVQRLQTHFKETLVKQSAAIFATPDGQMAVLTAISKEYQRSHGTRYWFAFRPAQQTTLKTYSKAWVSFGCGSEKQLFIIPLEDFQQWLPRFFKTELEDRYYWHVEINEVRGAWNIDVMRGHEKVDLQQYLLRAK